ncbi:MAG: ExbD/TolR family protein [Candidatus Methylumidiphilus sp.]
MAFKTDSSDREAMSEINVTPLVDVMLVLLIVFIVTAPLLTQEIKVDLPKTEKAQPPADNSNHLSTLAIDAAGKITLNDEAQTLQTLEQTLRARLQADPDIILQLQASQTVPYGTVAEAMALAQKAGIVKLAMVTTPK